MMGIVFAYFLPKIQGWSHLMQRKIVLIAIVLITTLYSGLIFASINMQNYMTYSFLLTICPLGVGLILSLLILIFHPQSIFVNYKLPPKTLTLLVHFSKLSYSLYLIHGPILTIVTNSIRITLVSDISQL